MKKGLRIISWGPSLFQPAYMSLLRRYARIRLCQENFQPRRGVVLDTFSTCSTLTSTVP